MRQLILDNGTLRAVLLPELGAKICSLLSLDNQREHLLQPPERPHQLATYGAAFADFDTSGLDECFPTVGACRLGDVHLPDHGELWSLPWQVLSHSKHSAHLQVEGRVHPYLFQRRAELRGHALHLAYRLTNCGDESLPYLWSCHPLLNVGPGDRVELSPEIEQLRVEWSALDRLGGEVTWSPELALLTEASCAHKLFAGPLSEGTCRLVYQDGSALTVTFPPELIPYLGLWICQGGWPEDKSPGHYTLALEPCTAPYDRLDVAVTHQVARYLTPSESQEWSLSFEITPKKEKEVSP